MWEPLLVLVQKDCLMLGMTFLDRTNIRVHQRTAGASRNRTRQNNATSVRPWADRNGWSPTGATAATRFANTSGAWAHGP